MSNPQKNQPPKKKSEQDEKDAKMQPQEEPKKEINEALKDDLKSLKNIIYILKIIYSPKRSKIY